MRLFLILFVGVIVIVVVQAVRAGAAGLVGAPIGVVVGYLLGLVASHMLLLSRNNDGHKVVGRMDIAGAIVWSSTSCSMSIGRGFFRSSPRVTCWRLSAMPSWRDFSSAS